MTDRATNALELADWRRRVAELFGAWRAGAATDPAAATDRWRAGRDELFGTHPKSPIPADARSSFNGLPHWPYDPAYRMSARLDPLPGDVGQEGQPDEPEPGASVVLPASTAEAFRFLPVGTVSLSGPLEGQRLGVYWILGYAGGLFLPFRDATSGRETYGAGRYLLDTIKSADHGIEADGRLILDFNLAFHPSCAYDPKWSCPLAPPENRLTVPVPAGERLIAGSH